MANILVLMTNATKEEAHEIVNSLLEKHLIACANILTEVDSSFWWLGDICKAKEFFVIMKSDETLFDELCAVVKEMHSYEVPEILAIPIVKGWSPYLKWLNVSLRSPER